MSTTSTEEPTGVMTGRLSAEQEAILICIQAACHPDNRNRLRRLVADGLIDRNRLWRLAGEQQVSPLVACALTGAPLAECVPEQYRLDGMAIRAGTKLYNLALQQECRRIAAAFGAVGITTVPLKGVFLAERIYGCLEARQATDLDILVPEAKLAEAREMLQKNGYTPATAVKPGVLGHSFHAVPYVREAPPFRFVVELHWALNDQRFVAVDYPSLWNRILADLPGPGSLGALPGEELLAFLALHLYKHDAGLLRLLADVDRLVRREGARLDWSHVVALAHAWGVRGPLYFALAHARSFLGTPVPEEIPRRLAPTGWQRRLVGALLSRRAILDPWASEHLRANRFRLAYCAMLSPTSRSIHAYAHYFFPGPAFPRPGPVSTAMEFSSRVIRGIVRTSLVLASLVIDP